MGATIASCSQLINATLPNKSDEAQHTGRDDTRKPVAVRDLVVSIGLQQRLEWAAAVAHMRQKTSR